MTTSRRALGLGGSIVAATAALVLVGSSAASAHHCYKDEWQAAAYAHHLAGGTPWMPLSDMGQDVPHSAGAPGVVRLRRRRCCRSVHGSERSHAGAADPQQGDGRRVEQPTRARSVKPFSYLADADFEWLTVDLLERLDECADGVSELRRRRAADYRQRPRRCAASTAERRSDAPSLRYRCSWCL